MWWTATYFVTRDLHQTYLTVSRQLVTSLEKVVDECSLSTDYHIQSISIFVHNSLSLYIRIHDESHTDVGPYVGVEDATPRKCTTSQVLPRTGMLSVDL